MANDKSIITKTNDGYVVELFGNSKKDIKNLEIVEGITILEPEKSLVEDELYETYKEIVEQMDYTPIVIRVPAIEKEPMVLKTQIRAILRAAKFGDLSILFPGVASIFELQEYKEILEQCQKELELENTPHKKHMKIGVIVEIPSAALMSYGIAKECDFLFVDADSLTDYAFGGKNNNEVIQPAIIKLIQQAKQGAHDAGIFCGISGKIVENELYIPLLIGLGLDQFSMESNKIENTRKIISSLDKYDCKELVEEILELRTTEYIEKRLKQFNRN